VPAVTVRIHVSRPKPITDGVALSHADADAVENAKPNRVAFALSNRHAVAHAHTDGYPIALADTLAHPDDDAVENTDSDCFRRL
jgi:hypothetical protein